MKKILVMISLFTFSAAFAECPKGISGSGRIWPSPIKKIVLHKKGCKIIPSRGQTDADPFCPLDDSSVMSKGIEVGLVNGKCAYKEGANFSGNLVNVDDELWSESHWLRTKKEKKDVIGDKNVAAEIYNPEDRRNTKDDLPSAKPSGKKSSGATAQ